MRFTHRAPGVSEIAFAEDLTDSKAGGRWGVPTGWPIVERADLDNAADDAFYPPWIRVSEIDVAIDRADAKAGCRWAAPTGWPIVESADLDNASVEAFYPPWIMGFPKSLSR